MFFLPWRKKNQKSQGCRKNTWSFIHFATKKKLVTPTAWLIQFSSFNASLIQLPSGIFSEADNYSNLSRNFQRLSRPVLHRGGYSVFRVFKYHETWFSTFHCILKENFSEQNLHVRRPGKSSGAFAFVCSFLWLFLLSKQKKEDKHFPKQKEHETKKLSEKIRRKPHPDLPLRGRPPSPQALLIKMFHRSVNSYCKRKTLQQSKSS